MKALTLYQPWATLVAVGEKKIETRSWKTDYRGPLLIHAGKNYPGPDVWDIKPFRELLLKYGYREEAHNLPLGEILCIVKLIGCIPADKCSRTDQESLLGDYSSGCFAWIFDREIICFKKPLPAKGRQRLWDYILFLEARNAYQTRS